MNKERLFKKSEFTCSRSSILTAIEEINENEKNFYRRTRNFI